MAHEEIIRLVPGADTAVLFLHGIAGTPNHFRDILPLIGQVPEQWSVYSLRLPGHGGTVDDFSHSSMRQWREYAKQVYGQLAQTHAKVILVGHSMGNLFAMQIALEHPERIPFVFMIAAPMRPWVRLFGIKNLFKLAFGKLDLSVPLEASTSIVCGLTTTRKLWKYVKWVPRFLELFAEIVRTEWVMGGLMVPCVAFQSRKDELVSNFAAGVLRKSGVVEVHELPESTHFYYDPEDQQQVFAAFSRYIERCT